MNSILQEIIRYKQTHELPQRMRQVPLSEMRKRVAMAPPPRNMVTALRAHSSVALIAEVKRASPSRGLLRPDFDPIQLATSYAAAGAAAISVVTDAHFFQGDLSYLSQIRGHLDLLARSNWNETQTSAAESLARDTDRVRSPDHPTSALPLLRKDFLIHPYQVYESRAAGADAVLLIAALLDDDMLKHMLRLAEELGMTALVEIHTAGELARVLPLRPHLIGVNNRDLHTFEVSLDTCLHLRPLVSPEICYVAESGIHTYADVMRLRAAGVDAMLVGEALVTASDVVAKVRELCYGAS